MINVGDRFGQLTTLRPERVGKISFWWCRCDCGREKRFQYASLACAPRPTRSCGCMRIKWLSEARITHGASIKNGSPEFNSFLLWQSIIWRCENKARRDYQWYGARGIKICQRWRESFENFRADMGLRPLGKTIDRINNNGDYEPSNCRWVTMKEQARNRRSNRLITFQGITHTLEEWGERTGKTGKTISERLARGWSVERAMTEPIRGTLRVAYG